jgi:O-antigen/teichoic acid export membrane protein
MGFKLDTTAGSIFRLKGFSRYFENFSWIFAQKIATVATSFLVGIFVARYLGPANYGDLNYAISFSMIFGSFLSLGLRKIIVRELVKYPAAEGRLMGTGFVLNIAGFFVFFLLVATSLLFTGEDKHSKFFVLIVAAGCVFQSFNIIDQYFQSKVLSKKTTLCQFIAMTVAATFKLTLIVLKASLFWFVLAVVFETVVTSTGYIITYAAYCRKFTDWRFDLGLARGLLKVSWLYILSGLMVGIYTRIDQVMIKNMLGSRDLGCYSIAVKLVESWNMIPQLLSLSLFPAIVAASQSSKEIYQARMQSFYNMMVLGAMGIIVILIIVAKPVILLFYGDQYLPAVPSLQLYALSLFATIVGIASSQQLIAENLIRIDFLRTFSGMISNVGLNFLFIPAYGAPGAAAATAISYTIALLVTFVDRKTWPQAVMIIKAVCMVDLFRFASNRIVLLYRGLNQVL